MARPIDYRSTLSHPAAEVYATMVDAQFLRERLARIGGKNAALLEHTSDAGGTRYRLQHGVDSGDVPAMVRSFLHGDIVIGRTETWSRRDGGGYTGTTEVTMGTMPASAAGGMGLEDVDAGSSEFHVHAEVSVNVPLFGGKIEEVVAGQIRNLLAMEVTFASDWLAKAR